MLSGCKKEPDYFLFTLGTCGSVFHSIFELQFIVLIKNDIHNCTDVIGSHILCAIWINFILAIDNKTTGVQLQTSALTEAQIDACYS